MSEATPSVATALARLEASYVSGSKKGRAHRWVRPFRPVGDPLT